MNKKILLASIFVLIVALSIGSIYASDVNNTDSYTTVLDDSSAQQLSVDEQDVVTYESDVDNDASDDVLKSDTSSNLSTNTGDSNTLESDDNAASNDAGNSTTATLNLSKTITSKDVTKYYKGSKKYTATFLDINGSALVNTKVNITIKGVTYTKTTNSKGVVSFNIDLKPGTYKVIAKNPSTGFSLTTTYKILDTIHANDLNKVYLDGKKFVAKFYKSNGKVLANKYVKIKINGKTYKVKTTSYGNAKLSLKYLKKGTYKIICYNTDGRTKTNVVKVIKTSTTTLTTKTYSFLKSAASKTIKVTLLNKYKYAPPKGQIIKFKISGKTYTAKTNANGVAKLKLPSLKAGTYSVKYSFAKSGNYKASSKTDRVYILPSKTPTFTVKGTKTFGYGAATPFKLAVTSGVVPIVNKKVTLSVNGKSYTKVTNNNGLVSIKIKLGIGTYKMAYSVKADSKLKAKSGSTNIKVVERVNSSEVWKSATTFYQGTRTCKVLLTGVNNTPISGATVKLTVNSKEYTAVTGSNGYATFTPNLPVGNYSVSYSFDGDNTYLPSSGMTKLTVKKITGISINDIVKAARTVKTYYANHDKVPSSVTAGGVKFTMPEFLYLLSKAIVQLGNSKTSAVTYISGVKAPASPTGNQIYSAQLTKTNYLKVANNVVNYIEKNKQAPNYASSAVGKIIFSELIDASARIIVFYADNNKYMPNYVTVTYTTSGGSSSGDGINQDDDGTTLSQYLKATTNCQVDASAIKSIVKSVTSGLTSVSAKAKAIYNYVRDSISYSFYYNTKYGATGTLSAKKGNCVDQAHLVIAMLRTADIPARYVHGTCKFSSGSTYGHVWAQAYVNGKWVVADPTSSRNSFGTVVNWDTSSYTLHGKYASLSF